MNNRLHTRAGLNRAVVSSLVAGACALLGTPALASTITFETLMPAAYDSGVTLTEAGYSMLLIEGPVAASMGLIGGTGTVFNGSDPDPLMCTIAGCPVGNMTNYLGILNDGAVKITRNSEFGFNLERLDFGFITPAPVGPGEYAQLQLAGTLLDGTSYATAFDFPGQNAAGNFTFGTKFLDPAFSALVFSSLTINACLFTEDTGSCVNSVTDPARNQAQFAIDNLQFGNVPEPASYLLAGMGMAALGWSRRRRAPRATAAVQGA